MKKYFFESIIIYMFVLISVGCKASEVESPEVKTVEQNINTEHVLSIKTHPIDPNTILLATTNGEVLVYDLDTSVYKKIEGLEKYKIVNAAWSNNADYIAFTHKGDIYIYDVKESTVNQVTTELDVYFSLVWKSDSEILFTLNNDDSEKGCIYAVDINTKLVNSIFKNKGDCIVQGYESSSNKLFFSNYESFYETKIDENNKLIRKILSDDEDLATEGIFTLSHSGSHIIFYGYTVKDSEGSDVFVANVSTGKYIKVEESNGANVFSAIFNSDMSKLIYLVQQKSGAIEIIVKPITDKMLKGVS